MFLVVMLIDLSNLSPAQAFDFLARCWKALEPWLGKPHCLAVNDVNGMLECPSGLYGFIMYMYIWVYNCIVIATLLQLSGYHRLP
jgi:hypothetical protein